MPKKGQSGITEREIEHMIFVTGCSRRKAFMLASAKKEKQDASRLDSKNCNSKRGQ